ncbi:MAG: hypothetical protein KAJ29_02090 [Alphaproteobacteria bacterium]|nr:hypothetical protein [Alphaproteobacteria bacterium]
METKEKALSFFYTASFIGLCLALLPWLNTYWSQVINTDIAYLTLSAGHMLEGLRMSEAYYDTNLPLSIIVQLPAAALAKFTGIPLYYATNIYALSLLTLSLAAVGTLLSYFKELTPEQRITILGAYLLTNTLMPGYDFGQKDHFLGMALFPLVLTQILITSRVSLPTILKYSVLAAGSLFILIKPHYGIIPASIFIHRAITQRRLSVIRDTDFLWLTGMAISYVAILLIFFNDFLTIILPDIVKYYASDISIKVVFTGIILMLQAIIPFFIAQLFLKKAPGLISALSLIATLCFIPFIIQGKGWAYHSLPADMFSYGAAILLLSYGITAGINTLRKTDTSDLTTRAVSFILPMLLLFTLVSKHYMAPQAHSLTHEDYKNTKFAKRIEECAKEYSHPCSFMMLNDILNISQELQVYTGTPSALRFPFPWFVPVMLNAEKSLNEGTLSSLTQEELNAANNKYMEMIAQDFERNDPKLVFVVHVPNPVNREKLFDFRNYTLDNAPDLFIPIWNRYELEESLMVNRLDYMYAKLPGEDLIRYDIYRKKKNTEKEEIKEISQP